MAEVVRYINTASVGGDGTTNATSGAQAAYSGGRAWELAERTNLVTDGDTHHVFVTGGNDALNIEITGANWTVDSTHYITFEVSDSHGGIRPTSTYRIDINDGFDFALTVSVPYTRIIGLAASNISVDGGTFLVDANNIQLINCLSYDGGTNGFTIAGNGDSCFLIDCVSYGATDDGFENQGQPVALYNCVSINSGVYGFYTGSFDTSNLKNCYAGGSGIADYFNDGTQNITTCGSEDGTAGATIPLNTDNFTNVTAGSEDVHIPDTGSDLYDAGTDLSADGTFPFDYDWEDDTRVQWDIGADEFISVGGLSIPVAMRHYRNLRVA